VDHGQIEWPKVLVEWEVSEIIVDVEEEGVLEILWWSLVADPIELILDDLNRCSY
jgi:hypothetical protein